MILLARPPEYFHFHFVVVAVALTTHFVWLRLRSFIEETFGGLFRSSFIRTTPFSMAVIVSSSSSVLSVVVVVVVVVVVGR